MKVSELAQELKTTNKVILDKLKALKLKAKDGDQELNRVVVSVLKTELAGQLKENRTAVRPEVSPRSSRMKAPEPEPQPEFVPEEERKPKGRKPRAKSAEKETDTSKKTVEKEKKETPARKKTVSAKIKESEESTPVKEKLVSKAKTKISDAPFVALKPLAKKKRKSPTRGRDGSVEEPRMTGAESVFVDQQPVAEIKTAEPPESSVVLKSQPAAPTQNLKPLELRLPITVKDFSVALQQKPSAVLKHLLQSGIFANINQALSEEIVRKVAADFGFDITEVKTQEEMLVDQHIMAENDTGELEPRAPVVTFMGHVDHGKTSLLDRIRRSRVTDQEHGGITQHIGAYSMKIPKGRITFLDTPGHEAFTAMRARGAHITDLVVLVVAADEGIMPQTVEAVDHARAAEVPILVALSKVDLRNADPDRVKKQLADHGLNPEDWGGKTVVVGVSAKTGEGIDTLLEMILLEAEMLELRANAQKPASGIVVEAHLSGGKGSVASLIVQSGTLSMGDFIVVGPYYGKVKALFDDLEKPIVKAGPSMPVEVLGLSDVPEAGEKFYVVPNERQAREISSYRSQQLKEKKLLENRKITLEDLYSQIQKGQIKELNVILKADVQGSVEALKDSLEKIPSQEVKIRLIHAGVGDVNASDVILAAASNAVIIAFHVGIGPRAKEELEKNPIDVREYRIIYDAVNDMRKALEGLLAPKIKRKFLARIDVRQVFKLSKAGIIAGSIVTKGKVPRNADIDLIRNGETVFTGKISSLKRFKDDVREVAEGFECGISIANHDDIRPGDVIEAFELESILRKL